ncbi:thiamine phosphate synthase [Paludisphaera borealis]|uniref:Thiamine-phosphate synthase n=1 Tax=Paludisphaera borealis TaxID=1387353 RepID=A0A1U7CXF2_9BACT|nr:thiamine phosphate synthase [Paludisphaera borealis]APW63632.1 Thiamine-phosphate synthase [Paludisphaera borealis]
MNEMFTPGAQRAMDRAEVRARQRDAAAVEPRDLLVALVDEPECRAAELVVEFGSTPDDVRQALGAPPVEASLPAAPGENERGYDLVAADRPPVPHSRTLRAVVGEAMVQARAAERSGMVGTEHLLAGLTTEAAAALEPVRSAGLDLERLREYLSRPALVAADPVLPLEDVAPLDLSDSARSVDIGRILDASANRAREGLRVVEDFARFALDDPGLTRRLKETRHRLAETLRGFDPDLLIGSRDTPDDVGAHIMTHSEQIRENPRAVLVANFKRTAEALRSLEEYGKLVNVWLAGRFEVLRYDVYTLEKLVLTAVQSYRALGDARLMVLVGGLPTLGDLTWIVGEALAGGADVIQLREKNLPDRELLTRAREVRILTAQAKARFIVNDRPDLARLAGADGVHLGQDDVTVRDARRITGPHLLIGVSTHERAQVDAAVLAGAGYLGVGPIFPSATKEFSEPELAGLAFARTVAEMTRLPWFAIGGITEENVERVVEAGASRIAVSAAVVRASRPRAATTRLRALLDGREFVDDDTASGE